MRFGSLMGVVLVLVAGYVLGRYFPQPAQLIGIK